MKNSNKNQNSSERIAYFLENQGVTQYKFFKEVGLSNGFLSKNRSIGSKSLEKISAHFPQLNLEWVIMGKGEMLREAPKEKEEPAPNPRSPIYNESAPDLSQASEVREPPISYGGGDDVEFLNTRFLTEEEIAVIQANRDRKKVDPSKMERANLNVKDTIMPHHGEVHGKELGPLHILSQDIEELKERLLGKKEEELQELREQLLKAKDEVAQAERRATEAYKQLAEERAGPGKTLTPRGADGAKVKKSL